MENCRGCEVYYHYPSDVWDQLTKLPPEHEQISLLLMTFSAICNIFRDHQIIFDEDKSGCRLKRDESIREKVLRRNSVRPLTDIFGFRFVVEDPYRKKAELVIKNHYLLPLVSSNDKPVIREYRDRFTRESIIGSSNSNFGQIYSALHINFLCAYKPKACIAEIQIMSEQEYVANFRQRTSYKQAKK